MLISYSYPLFYSFLLDVQTRETHKCLCVPPEISAKLIADRAKQTGRTGDIHEKSRTHLEDSYRAALYASAKLGWTTVRCTEGEGGPLRTREDIHGELLREAERVMGYRKQGKDGEKE